MSRDETISSHCFVMGRSLLPSKCVSLSPYIFRTTALLFLRFLLPFVFLKEKKLKIFVFFPCYCILSPNLLTQLCSACVQGLAVQQGRGFGVRNITAQLEFGDENEIYYVLCCTPRMPSMSWIVRLQRNVSFPDQFDFFAATKD